MTSSRGRVGSIEGGSAVMPNDCKKILGSSARMILAFGAARR
jgi:hypothetical protein